MYNDKVMTTFISSKNAGVIKGANGVGKVGDAECGCGDVIKIFILVNENNIIEKASFKTFGCVAAIACSSVAADLIKGKNLGVALNVADKDIIKELGELPNEKAYCARLAQDAVGAAVADYEKRKLREERKKAGK